MYSYKLLSHPHKLLREHVKEVYSIGINTFKHNEIIGYDYKKFLEILLISHDLGKATGYFQEYIRGYKDHGILKNHGFLSSLFAYLIIYNEYNEDLALKGLTIIRRHHGDLHNIISEFELDDADCISMRKVLVKQLDTLDFDEVNAIINEYINFSVDKKIILDTYDELFDEMKALDIIDESLRMDEKEFFKYKYYYSILIYSDKASLIIDENKKNRESISIKNLNKYFSSLSTNDNVINAKRNEAKLAVQSNIDNLNSRLLTITLPTGLGKTLNSLNFALNLQKSLYENKSRKYDIIYSFPFTSIIDQTYEIFQNIFGDKTYNVLKHHYLSPVKYKDEEDFYEVDKSKFLIETWESNITVTTFIKLLHCIFSNKNNELIKFHKFARKIIILDEVQNIPYKYWKIIGKSFDILANTFDIYFILMTATKPLIFTNGYELVNDPIRYFSIFNRTRLIIDMSEKTIDDFIEEISPIVEKKNKVMIVLNTVKSAQDVYKKLKEKSKREIIFLSASIIPAHRKKRIDKIKKLKNYILVSTQVVEAGIDIDNDIVIRDIAPWDSIVQCAGRCNRNNKKDIGDVYIFKLKGERYIFANLVYGRFLISKTENILQGKKIIYENEYFDYSNKYFKEISKEKSDDHSNKLLDLMNSFSYLEVSREFKLIDNNDLQIIPVFIEVNEQAQKIWEEYEKIYSIENPIIKKNKFLLIKDKFLSYVININYSKYYFDKSRFYGRIPKENVDDYYSEEFGFYIDDNKTLFF